MDVFLFNFCLFIFLCDLKVVRCDTYSITGLVVASTCAGVLFVVTVAVAVIAFTWKEASYEYLTSRAMVKMPRSWIERQKRKCSPKARAKARKEIEMRFVEQQRRRANMQNAWRENFQSQRAPVSMDPGNVNNRIDRHENGIQSSPIVTEVESDRGSRFIPYSPATRSSRFSNYSNSNMAHFGNAAIQNNKMSVSTQSINLSDDDVLESASRAATLEVNRKDEKHDNTDDFIDNTAKFQRRHLYNNGPRHKRYSSFDSDPGVV